MLGEEALLGHIFDAGVLREENCRTAYQEIATELSKKSPELLKFYLGLIASEKEVLGIAEIP